MKNEDIEKKIVKLSKIVKFMPPCSARDEKEDELYMLKKQLKKRKYKVGRHSIVGPDKYQGDWDEN